MNDNKQHSAAIDGLEYVAQVVRRYAEIEKIYLQSGDLNHTQDLEAEVVKLYRGVLEYEARAACQFDRHTAIRIARNIVEADGWNSILESLKTSDTACAKFMSIVDSKDQRQSRRNLENALAEQDMKMDELLRRSHEQEETFKKLLSEQQTWRQTVEEHDCHQLFRTSEYERHKSRNPDRVNGTCEWFLTHLNYNQWLERVDSSLLWVSADPGCGKSVLSKSLIDHELSCTAFRSTCYFFFKDDNPEQNSAVKALCALLHQLFSLKPMLLKHALPEFKQNGKNLCEIFDILWGILVKAAADPESGEVICVLDALDECENSGRLDLIERCHHYFGDIVKQKPDKTRLKFLITSRPYFDLERHFSTFPTIHLSGDKETESISREIEKVIRVKVQEIGDWFNLAASVRLSLEKKLMSVTNRTYLWLKLIFDVITKQLEVTKKRLLRIVDTLPDTVEKAYTAILNRSTDPPRAKKILHIIVAAHRPLSLREMNIALAVEESTRSYDDLDLEPEELFRTTVRNLCGLFVNVIDSRIFLIHQTARMFLVRDEAMAAPVGQSTLSLEYWKESLQPSESDLILAKACISYLLFDIFESQLCVLKSDTESVSEYEAIYEESTYDGVTDDRPSDDEATYNQATDDQSLEAEATDDRASDIQASDDRAPYNEATDERKTLDEATDCFINCYSHIYYFIVHYLTIYRLLVQFFMTYYFAAAIGGRDTDNKETVNEKIGNESSNKIYSVYFEKKRTNVEGSEASSFVSRQESLKGDLNEMKFNQYADLHGFLEYAARHWVSHFKKAEIMDESPLPTSALQVCDPQSPRFRAWFFAHLLQTKLDYWFCADITLLMVVSILDLEDLVSLLLRKDVDVNEMSNALGGWTALSVAAIVGRSNVVRLLLEKAADTKLHAEGPIPLHCAVMKAMDTLDRFMPDEVPNPEVSDGLGVASLPMAVRIGAEAIVRLLENNGAPISDKHASAQAALHEASPRDSEAVVEDMERQLRQLQHTRASTTINDETRLGRMTRELETKRELLDYVKITRLLLQYGADMEAIDDQGMTVTEMVDDHLAFMVEDSNMDLVIPV